MPERDFSFEQLDRMSQKQPNKGTWWPPMLIEIHKLGLLVKNIESFDYNRFYEEGEAYVRSIYPKDTAQYYLDKSNLNDIKPLIPEFMEKTEIENRAATIEDIDRLLAGGWLVGIDLNSRTLNNAGGYSSHMVVIFDADKHSFWLHDPGLKPSPNRKVSRHKLAEAWFYSGRNNAGLVALRSS